MTTNLRISKQGNLSAKISRRQPTFLVPDPVRGLEPETSGDGTTPCKPHTASNDLLDPGIVREF
jgi:hypothetical protein